MKKLIKISCSILVLNFAFFVYLLTLVNNENKLLLNNKFKEFRWSDQLNAISEFEYQGDKKNILKKIENFYVIQEKKSIKTSLPVVYNINLKKYGLFTGEILISHPESRAFELKLAKFLKNNKFELNYLAGVYFMTTSFKLPESFHLKQKIQQYFPKARVELDILYE